MRAFHEKGRLEAGCDEAGRGCLAGPVFAAAVILPEDFFHPLLNDSKQLTENQRVMLRPIIEKEAIAWAVAEVSPKEIDEINILWASVLAMQKAVGLLKKRPDFLLIDGNRFRKYQDLPHLCVVKGDAIYASIAAASVLAKTNRDDRMTELDLEFPQYFWKKNKGYPAPAHRAGIREFGPTEHHRMSFRLLPEENQLSLF